MLHSLHLSVMVGSLCGYTDEAKGFVEWGSYALEIEVKLSKSPTLELGPSIYGEGRAGKSGHLVVSRVHLKR